MATHSIILSWRIPWSAEPGELQSTGLQSQTRLKQLSTHARVTEELVTRPLGQQQPLLQESWREESGR